MIDYVELRTHSANSLLIGTASTDVLVSQAVALRMPAIALTDHNNVYGAMRFQQTALALNIKPILGAELTLEGGYALPLLVKSDVGWENLCWLISKAQHQADKGEGLLYHHQLEGRTGGLIALSGGREGEVNRTLLEAGLFAAAKIAERYVQWFGRENYWIELHHHYRPYDERVMAECVKLANSLNIGYVATNHIHYVISDDKDLQDVVTAIRHKTSLDNVQAHLFPNGHHYLKSGDEIQKLFHRYPQALKNTLIIAEQCNYRLPSELQALPEYPKPDGLSADTYLAQVCRDSNRYDSAMKERLQHELEIIAELGLSNYFLVVWDIVTYAWSQNIRCQGRGSAANSLVAYLLKISPIDPIKHRLVFERFLSRERQIAPDIDMDFDANEREKVIQYLYNKYGRSQAAMACTYVSYKERSAIRDVAKAWGFTASIVPLLKEQWELWQENPTSNPHLSSYFEICRRLIGKTKFLGIHNGGEVISDLPLHHRIPTEPARMKDRTVVQADKEWLEDAGIIKIDVLGLKMLSAITEMVEKTGVDIDSVGFDDPKVYEMIAKGKTFGVFQCESRAQMNFLPRLNPKRFIDIVIAISIIRPGPSRGKMVPPYLKRRMGLEPVTYLHDSLQPALEETLGVALWQEQVLKIAHDFAGFSHGQGELLRRALGSKHAFELLGRLEAIFIDGAMQKGVEEEIVQTVFEQLRAFGSYSFAKSHAASFAVLSFQSAWFKYHHPSVFYTAILNNQPMGFWSAATIMYDAKRNGISIYSVDINLSDAKCTIEGNGIRIGLEYVSGLKGKQLENVIEARKERPFTDLQDFLQRVKLPLSLVEQLIKSGAMDMWHPSRHQLIWDAGIFYKTRGTLPLKIQSPTVPLPETTLFEQFKMEWQATKMCVHHHPMEFYRRWCREHRISHSKQIWHSRDGISIQAAGMLIIMQAPQTANGVRFLVLEDEYELINIVVFPNIYKRFRKTIRNHRYLRVKGKLQRDYGVINIIAEELYPLPPVECLQ